MLVSCAQVRRETLINCFAVKAFPFTCAAPARIFVTPPSPGDNYTLEVGRLVDIRCQTLFGSENTLISYKLGEAVPQPTPNSFFQPILTTELAVTPDDAGVYRCVSANAFENSSVDITINVLGKTYCWLSLTLTIVTLSLSTHHLTQFQRDLGGHSSFVSHLYPRENWTNFMTVILNLRMKLKPEHQSW